MILDSGSRTEFNTGAVRDLKGEDKGRCDAMPLKEVADFLHDTIINDIAMYQKTYDIQYIIQAIAEFVELNFKDYSTAILELSIHFRNGLEKYGLDNWKKGIPEWSYIDSSIRHYLKWCRGDDDERHDRAFLWNMFCLWWTHNNIGGEDDKTEE